MAQGRLGEALGWAREQGLSVENELSYLREFDHITLARVLLARYQSDHADRSIHEAMGLLECLLKAAEEGGRTGSVIEILVLQAIAHHAQGDTPGCPQAAAEGSDAGRARGLRPHVCGRRPTMMQLLREAASRGIMPGLYQASCWLHLMLRSEKAQPNLVQPLTNPYSRLEKSHLVDL